MKYVSKGGKRVDLDNKFYRSKAEANWSRYLKWLVEKKEIKGYEHEPQEFWFPIKRGCVSYLPDFKIIKNDGSHYWHEVKGYMDPKSITKIKRFNKYYPNEKLEVILQKQVQAIGRQLGMLIPHWE